MSAAGVFSAGAKEMFRWSGMVRMGGEDVRGDEEEGKETIR